MTQTGAEYGTVPLANFGGTLTKERAEIRSQTVKNVRDESSLSLLSGRPDGIGGEGKDGGGAAHMARVFLLSVLLLLLHLAPLLLILLITIIIILRNQKGPSVRPRRRRRSRFHNPHSSRASTVASRPYLVINDDNRVAPAASKAASSVRVRPRQ